jgi:hypothetical protein
MYYCQREVLQLMNMLRVIKKARTTFILGFSVFSYWRLEPQAKMRDVILAIRYIKNKSEV